ncbi:MAG TPA: phage virion morphogenesis protein [Gemmobacter sp.]|nr:phage virion morphogenesis protein [Gemmobacter sp.]HBU14056.1 phage virion morphogenesis protein [Gemmobacter sp.]
MAGVTFSFEVDDSETSAALAAIIGRIEQRRGFYRAVGQLLADSARENFRKQAGPDGKPWQRLRPATIKRRQSLGQVPLTILRSNTKAKQSSLVGSLNFTSDNDAARLGTPVPYGAIHQFGGTIAIPARKGRIYRHYDPNTLTLGRKFVSSDSEGARATEVDIPAYTITMPARPFLGISPADEKEIIALAEDWLGLENG